MKKTSAVILAVLLMLPLAGCWQSPEEIITSHTPNITASISPEVSDTPYICQIGIVMPDKSQPRWERDGTDIKNQLEAKGYTVELMYADNYYQGTQNSQIEELVAKGCRVLVVTPIDYFAVDFVLAEAKEAGVTVIAYDRMIESTHVDYGIKFDIFRFGALQGEYIEDALDLKDGKGPFNIELFAGAGNDGNMMFYFEGGMSILRPYIENGQLIVKSGQTDSVDVYTDDWKTENAKARMDNLLAEYYTKDKLDAVFALNDSIARGIIASLEDAGYNEFPIITGMDCDKDNVIAIKAGKQSMSVFPDTRILTTKLVEMVGAVMTGSQVPITAVTEHISNGITFSMSTNGVRSFLCDPHVVTVDNIQEILIDGEYYTGADLEE